MLFRGILRIVLIFLIGVILLLTVSAYQIFMVVGEDELIRIPLLEGKDILEASQIINNLNATLDKKLTLQIIPKESVEYGLYTVIKQYPEPRDMQFKEGKTIKLYVSYSKANPKIMPNFKNLKFSKALELITLKERNKSKPKLLVGDILLSPSKKVSKGLVISHNPVGNSVVRDGTKVDFLISSGYIKNEVLVEDYVGKRIEKVSRYLSDKGLFVNIKNVMTLASKNDGKIIGQSAGKGEILYRGEEIGFRVYAYGMAKDSIRNYYITRFRIPSRAHPFFKDKKSNLVEITLKVEGDRGIDIIYSGKKHFGDEVVRTYRSKGRKEVEVLLDGREYKEAR